MSTVIAYLCHYPFCEYSDAFAEYADECGITYDIIDVTVSTPPKYVHGTPTLEVNRNEIYCGDAAFQWCTQNKARPLQQTQQVQEPIQEVEAPPTIASDIPSMRRGNNMRKIALPPPRQKFEFNNTNPRGRAPPTEMAAPVVEPAAPFMSATVPVSGAADTFAAVYQSNDTMLNTLNQGGGNEKADVLLQRKMAER